MADEKCSYRIAYEKQKRLVEARDKEIADLRAQLEQALDEVKRLNEWADGMTDAALKERTTGLAYQRELRDIIFKQKQAFTKINLLLALEGAKALPEIALIVHNMLQK